MLFPKQSRVGRALASAENANGKLRSILDDELTNEQFAVVKYYGRHNEAAPETAGIKQLGQGEIEWFDGTAVLEGKARHYQTIVEELAKLVMIDTGSSRGNVSTEAY